MICITCTWWRLRIRSVQYRPRKMTTLISFIVLSPRDLTHRPLNKVEKKSFIFFVLGFDLSALSTVQELNRCLSVRPHGSTPSKRRVKSLIVFGTSKILFKVKQGERSSACGQMVENSTFPSNSTVICSKWDFGANSVAGIRRSKTAWSKGRIGWL